MYYRVKTNVELLAEHGLTRETMCNEYGIGQPKGITENVVLKKLDSWIGGGGKLSVKFNMVGVGEVWLPVQSIEHINFEKVEYKNKLFSSSMCGFLADIGTPFSLALLKHYDRICTVDDIKNITLSSSDTKLLSYCKEGDESIITENGKWSRSNRTEAKTGRVLNKVAQMLGVKHLPKEMEILTYELLGMQSSFEQFQEVSGDDIVHYYHENQYDFSKSLGTLGNSCMRTDDCQSYFGIYADNPDVCRLIILKNGRGSDKIIGRALLWTTVDGNVFMDRVYGTDSVQTMFIKYAKDKGYSRKLEQGYDNKTGVVDGKGAETTITMQVKLNTPISEYEYYPYMDTFTYDNGDGETLTNVDTNALIGMFENIHGGYERIYLCDITGERGFNNIRRYFREDRSMGHAVERLLVYSDYIDDYILKDDSVSTSSGDRVYASMAGVELLTTTNEYEIQNRIFVSEHDGQRYSEYMMSKGSSLHVKIPLNNGKYVHSLYKLHIDEKLLVMKPKTKKTRGKMVMPRSSTVDEPVRDTWYSDVVRSTETYGNYGLGIPMNLDSMSSEVSDQIDEVLESMITSSPPPTPEQLISNDESDRPF